MTSLLKRQRIGKNPSPPENPAEKEPPGPPASISDPLVSFFVSVAFHASMLLILALFVHQTGEVPLLETLEARMDPLPEPEALALTEVSVEERLNASENTDSSKIQNEIRQLANASQPAPVTMAMLSNRGMLPSIVPRDGNGFGGDALVGLGETAGSGDVAGDGSEEVGDGEIGFFGTKAKGKSFVFIVDCSGSMNTPTMTNLARQQPLVTRYQRARQELYLSLGQLARDQTFFVIFYNHETFPMFFPQVARNLVPAVPNNLDQARSWIQRITPSGGTDPRQAFQIALAMRPDVIFFMTDGIIPAATRKVAKDHNKSRTRIHTIAFGIDNDQKTLKGIAEDNQGRFRFVP